MPDLEQSSYQQIETTIKQWAQRETAVSAILLIGSRARQNPSADNWSDLDLILFVADPEKFAAGADWLATFGEVLLSVLQRHSGADCEWLVLFANGLKVDFYLTPDADDLTGVIRQAPFFAVIQRGAAVWYVRAGKLLHLPPQNLPVWQPPTAVAFHNEINAMLLEAYKTAKFISRNDLWRARLLLDTVTRARLLTMIEWHARAVFSPGRDTWYNGRYLDQWADPRVLAALPNIFGHFNSEDTWTILFGSLALFSWLAQETAVALSFTYPQAADAQIMAWLREFYLTLKQV